MKQQGLTFGLSGAPREIVTVLGKQFQFTQSYGTTCTIENDHYTGQLSRNLVIHETKEALFQTILIEFTINPSTSFGFGDTEQDVSFLQAAS
jgi:phosphoserine phosphatase